MATLQEALEKAGLVKAQSKEKKSKDRVHVNVVDNPTSDENVSNEPTPQKESR